MKGAFWREVTDCWTLNRKKIVLREVQGFSGGEARKSREHSRGNEWIPEMLINLEISV